MNWINVSSDFTAAAGTAYFCEGPSVQINVTLPASPSQGDSFSLYALNYEGWSITLLSGQQVRFEAYAISAPNGVKSGATGDAVSFTYCSQSGIWECTDFKGRVNTY